MSQTTEKENIAKLRALVDQIEDAREKEKVLLSEVDALLRKKYPSSENEKFAKETFRFYLTNWGDISKAKNALHEDKIIAIPWGT